jgi:hypothetical protein
VWDYFKVGGQDTEFGAFARRVLSISANSASCERLFSVYGSILTKYRSRLLLKNLMLNAELKMHTRDENIRDKEIRDRLKRRFETRTRAALQEARRVQNATSARNPSSLAASTSTQPLASTSTQPTISSNIASQTGTNTAPSTASESMVSSEDFENPPSSRFRDLIEEEVTRVERDKDVYDAIHMPARLLPGAYRKITITDLFDFDNEHWARKFEESALRTFKQELDIYELLDLDADGDLDIEVDESTAQVLLG